MDQRKRVAVSPVSAFEARKKLFGALAMAHPVEFEPRTEGAWSGVDAVLVFSERAKPATTELPQLVLASDPPGRVSARVDLADDCALDPVLRNRRLEDAYAGGTAALEQQTGEIVVASAQRSALWTRRGGDSSVYRSSLAPHELKADEVLRDLLAPKRWFSLLPVEHFLRELTRSVSWTAPPLRAALMFDDPNLHWPTYGRLHFEDLARHASLHDYHVSVAMVPLDGRLVHPSVGQLFRRRSDIFSLVMHGNDHIRLELYREMAERDRRALVAQALRRSDAFELRHRIHVDRIMSSPHGLGAEDAMAAMSRLGVEAFTADWPFPWAPPDASPPGWPLAGWEPAQLMEGGFPVLPRYLFTKPLDDLVFRAYLNQPLIVYGHHRAGLDLLSAVARNVNGLGQVTWASLQTIARSNYMMRKEGSTLRVRPFSRRFTVSPVEGVENIVVELPRAYGTERLPLLAYSFANGELEAGATVPFEEASRASEPVPLPKGGGTELMVVSATPVDPYTVPAPPPRPWPILRRMLTESRDRLLPFMKQEI